MDHDETAMPFPCVHVVQTSQGSQQVYMAFDPLLQLVCGGSRLVRHFGAKQLFIFSHISSFLPPSRAM